MKRSPFAALLLAGIASPALADDLIISSGVGTPVSTATAANGTPGNITIQLSGSVSVTAAGAAATLNSSHTLYNIGTIQNSFTGTGAMGVHILGGFTGDFLGESSSSTIVNGNGLDSIGLLVDGASAFDGDVTFNIGSLVFVNGTNSVGTAIRAPLTGDLNMGAAIVMTGEGVTGIEVLAPIAGSLTMYTGISLAGTDLYTRDQIDPLTGSAVAVAASIGEGILNSGTAEDGDGIPSSNVASSGSKPTFAIQPSLAGTAASDITIGILTDTFNPNYSFINRGNIRATENDPGISTIGALIGENGPAANTVSLTGGIYNRGSIVAQAQTSNDFATSASAASADATGLLIGNGAVLNAGAVSTESLRNGGSIAATISGDKSGTATGLLILQGATVSSIVNTGATAGAAFTDDKTIATLNAYGLRDLSGTVQSLVNNGQLTASATTLDNGAQVAIAADLSSGAGNQTFNNTGNVVGDVLFGTAGMNGSVAGNQFTIEGANATFFGRLHATGSGTVDVHVSDGGTGGTFRTPSTQLTSLSVGSGGAVQMALNQNSASAPLISATGTVSFASGATLVLVPSTFLPDNGIYTLVHADGGLSFADFAASTTQPLPFIFNGGISRDSNDVVLTLQRKTATELGLTGNVATIYEPTAQAALGDTDFGSALLTLTTAAEVEAAVRSTVPDVAGGARALTAALTDQATGVIGARERNLITAPGTASDGFRFWGQQFYNNVSAGGTATLPGYNGAGQGVAIGVEWGNLNSGRFGLGYTFFSSQEIESHPRDTKTNGDWNMLSFYGGWRAGDFFITPQVNIGQGDFLSRRTVAAGSVVRRADAAWTNYLAAGGFTTGYILEVAGFQIMPQVAIDGFYLNEAEYTESGAGGMNLTIKQPNQKSVRSFAGVLGQGSYNWDNGTLQPQLLVGWSHEFMTSPATIDASFEAAPGSPFALVGPTLEPNKIVGGASVAYVFGNWSAGVSYDAARGTNSVAQSATVSLSSRF